MRKMVMAALTAAMLMALAGMARADNCATYFSHVGEDYTDDVSGGWLWCGIVAEGECAPISSLLSHADAQAFRTLLDTIGRRITPASRATFANVPFKMLLDVIQPNHTC